jgi:hypothetical protein
MYPKCSLLIFVELMHHKARAAEEKKIPNFVFGVTNLDGELYFRGSGTRVFDDPASGEVTPDSVFWICSQTKFITNERL